MSRHMPSQGETLYWLAGFNPHAAAVALRSLVPGMSRSEARETVHVSRSQDFTTNGIDVIEEALGHAERR